MDNEFEYLRYPAKVIARTSHEELRYTWGFDQWSVWRERTEDSEKVTVTQAFRWLKEKMRGPFFIQP